MEPKREAFSMADSIKDILNARYSYLTDTLNSLKKKSGSFPEGSINIKSTKYGIYYFLHRDKAKKYLGKNDSCLISQLVQKDYIARSIKAAEKEAAAIRTVINNYPADVIESVFDNLPEGRKKHATPLFLNNEDCAKYWLSIPYTGKQFDNTAPKFYTLKGEHVRSKSEVIIADRLYAKGIPYKYECPVIIGDVVIHPDFSILRLSDRKILYHEHCGRMGDSGYVEDFLDRVNKYGRAGVFTGDRLFFTFESSDHPLDISWLDDFIEKNYR